MLYLRTGAPGASKTLNTLKEIIEDKSYQVSEFYYHNVKLLMLDLDVCYSFAGFFYGEFYPSLSAADTSKYLKVLKRIHAQEELASLEDFPFLESKYDAYTQSDRPLNLFLSWCNRLYPKSILKPFHDFLELKGEVPLTPDMIRKFNLDFRKFDDPTKWMELPRGSVVFIDEGQDFFEARSPTAKRPPYLTEFSKHRHKGIDLHIVTQRESMIDKFITDNLHRHIHYFNKFGGSLVYRIEAAKKFNTQNSAELNSKPSTTIKRDKNYYGLYWSADVHTHRLRIPKKYVIYGFLFALAVSVVVYASFGLYQMVVGEERNAVLATANQSNNATADTGVNAQLPPSNEQARPLTNNYYFEENATSFAHPLAIRCTKIKYAGFEKIRRTGGFDIDHYFACFTGETSTYNKYSGGGKNNEENESDMSESQATADVIKLVAFDMLEELGYSIEFKGRFLILEYGQSQILFERHI